MEPFENNEQLPQSGLPQEDLHPLEPVASAVPAPQAEEPHVVPAAPAPQEPVVSAVPVPQESVVPTASVPQAEVPPVAAPAEYRNAGSGRKESPYANGPYVVNHPPRPEAVPVQPEYVPRYAAPKPEKKAKKGGIGRRILAAALSLSVVAGGCLITAASVNSYWESRNAQTVSQMNQQIADLQTQIDALSRQAGGNSLSGSPLSNTGMTPGQVYAQNVDSVVAISATVQTASIYGVGQGTSTGSGFILSAEGYIVTNCHVVEGSSAVSVILRNGEEYTAEILGTDSSNDIAVLKINAENLPAVTLGSSSDLVIGDMVVAIGNPLGTLTSTQTVGYVSGKDRDVTTDNTIINMIQTDAAINSGNSGGPLFNMKGEVVGITTAKYSGTTGSGASIEGIGFAIPIDDVLGIISDLSEKGYVTGAYLGVTVTDTNAEYAAMFGLPVGAYIQGLEEGGAAQRAGLQVKDIIIQVETYEVEGITTLTRALRQFKAGDVVTVTLIRSGQRMELEVTLDEKPHQEAEPAETQPVTPNDDSADWYNKFFGGNG